MKFKSLFAAAFAAVAVLAGCQPKEEPVEEAKISVSPTTISFDATAGDKTVQVTSTREWKTEIDKSVKEWVKVVPDGGSACPGGQTVTITVMENEGKDRNATVTFTIGLLKATVEISQVGKKGPDPVNDGSKEHPFTVPEAIQKCIEAGETPTTDFFYIKGFVSEIKEITDATGFGNATFYIKEAKDAATDAFYCYRVKYFNGAKFPSIDALKVGDDVVVKAQLVNYKSDTPETQNGEMYSINGKTAGDEPETLPITGANLLENGSFESWTGAKPEAWDFKSGNAILTKVGGAKEGSNACEIGGDPEGKTNYRLMSKEYTLNPGTYQIQVYVKGEGMYRLGYAKLTDHIVKDTQNDYIYLNDPVQATSDWTSYFVEFKIMEQTSVSITIMNSKKGNGKSVIVDDVRLVTQDGDLVPDVLVEALETESVAEVIAAPDDTPVKLSNALVVAAAKTGYLVTDTQKSAYLFVFKGNQTTETAPEVGDVVTVEATKGTYQKFAQLSEPKTTVVSSGSTVTHPSAEDISTNFDSFSSTSVKYVSFTGKLSISGSYYNVSVPGASANIGSLISPKQDLSAYKDVDNVRYEGYFVYVTGGKYINIVLTKAEPSEAKFFNVTPLTSTIDAAATTVDITVSSNVAWSASSDTDGFTLDKASGEGNATITVTCPENVSDGARTVKITVSTEADVTTKSHEVVITQNSALEPESSDIILTFPDDNKDNNKVGAYTKTWTAKSGSQEFTISNFNNNNWSNWTYIKCGSKSAASIATIVTNVAFAVKTVVVTVDACTSDKVKAFKLEVASDDAFTSDVQTVDLTIAKGDNTFAVPSPAAKAYYRLTFDCEKGSSNGLVTVSKLVFTNE